MWCPSCGSEYRPGLDRCPDCDVVLVEAEPQFEPADPSLLRGGPALATVFTGPSEEAQAVKELLDRRGVLGAIGPAGTEGSAGEVAIVVRAQEVPLALEIIESEDWESLVIEPGDPIYDESLPLESDGDEAGEPVYRDDLAAGTVASEGGDDYTYDEDAPDEDSTDWPSSMDAAGQPSPIREEVPWYSTATGRFVLGVIVLGVAIAVISRGMS